VAACFVGVVCLDTWVLAGLSVWLWRSQVVCHSRGEMVCYVLVPRRRWVASFGTEQKLCPAPIVVGDVDTLCIDFLPEGIIGVI
jgi:hypothetical protein